jgi:4'-phosphopantetheinyl transferase
MPLFLQQHSDDFLLGLWKMDETLDALQKMLSLSPSDVRTMTGFKSEYRKREWLTTRVLVKNLLPASSHFSIAYHENGKPFLVDSFYCISISHTKNYVAVILSKSESAGIDLETIQPRIEKIAMRFVTSEEELFIEIDKKIIYQHVIWGTKEVLFKIYGKGELNFLKHLHVESFQLKDKGELTGKIVKQNYKKEYRIFYQRMEGLMLVYAMSDKVNQV